MIKDLATHSAPYVTVSELAEYWGVSREQVLKHVTSGAPSAIRLGPRLFRIRTESALKFEQRVLVNGGDHD